MKAGTGSHHSSWMPSETTSSSVHLHPRSDPKGDDPGRDSACYRNCCTNLCCTLWAVWLGMVIIAVTMVLCVEFALFPRQTYETAPYDVRVVTQHGFGVFCRAAAFQSDEPFQVTLLPEHPRLNTTDITHHNTSVSEELSSTSSVYWGFYLLEGSAVMVSPCGRDTGFHQWVLKGKKTLQNWLNAGHGDYQAHAYVSSCDETFTYTINHTDDYYFYYTTNRSTTIDVKFALNRTNYDYSKNNGNFQCPANDSCHVAVPFNANPMLVYRANDVVDFGTPLSVECELGLPLFLILTLMGFIISVIIVLARSCCEQSKSHQEWKTQGQLSMSNQEPSPIHLEEVNLGLESSQELSFGSQN